MGGGGKPGGKWERKCMGGRKRGNGKQDSPRWQEVGETGRIR